MTGTAQMLTVRVPLAIRKRGGRKLVMMPDTAPHRAPARVDSTPAKVLGPRTPVATDAGDGSLRHDHGVSGS